MLNGKVKVMLITVCSLKSVQSSDGTRERTYVSGRHHLSRAELGPMPTWVVRIVAGVVVGSGRVPGEGWPLFDVLADVESGAFGLVLAP